MKITNTKITNLEEITFPQILYKYREWDNTYHQGLLTKREIFFPPPSGFEDPLDCKIPIRYDLLTYNEKIEFGMRVIKEREPGKPNHYYRQKAINLYPGSVLSSKSRIEEFQKQMAEDFDKRIGILCLTEHPDSFDMWNYYGKKHTGFCVGFDPKILFDYLGGGGKVIYNVEVPIIYPTPKHSIDEQLAFQIFCKEDKWSFEDEYRTFLSKMAQPLSLDDRKVEIPAEAYTEIIFGANMPEEWKEEIIAKLPSELKNIKIRHARLNGENVILD